MALPDHVLGVDLLKLILRSKDPFLPRFYCHSCKQKFSLPMKSTSPRPTTCTLCSSDVIEWVLPEDPHQRAARLRDADLFSRFHRSPSSSPSPPPTPPPPEIEDKPPEPKDEPMDTGSSTAAAEAEKTDIVQPVQDTSKPSKETNGEKGDDTKTEPMAVSSDVSTTQPTATEGGSGETAQPPPPSDPMEQEPAKKKAEPPSEPEEEPEDEEPEEEEEQSTGGRLSAQPMVVVSAGGDPQYPTLTMNLFPSLDEAGPRNEGRRGLIRSTIVQQKTSRNFTYLAQEYMAKIIEGGRGRAGQTRRGQQLLVGLTGGAQTKNSDPADFVWGARGLDSIISGLLESMSDRGPPPAKKDKVDAIPVVDATQEVVDEYIDGCTVCKDAFKVGDKLRKLPCNHLFHESCIIPWLKLHDTCPTCRYHVNTDKDKTSEDVEDLSLDG